MKANCKNCEQEFSYFPSQSTGKFCSIQCNHDYRVLAIMESGKANIHNALTYLKRFAEYECSECGINEWNGKHLPLQMDHIDGDRNNNTIDNIRWMCANCHSQTETWGSRNASPEGQKRINESRKIKRKPNRSGLTAEELTNMGR